MELKPHYAVIGEWLAEVASECGDEPLASMHKDLTATVADLIERAETP